MLIDLSSPVENQGFTVRSNSETGEPYLLLKLFNISEKIITSLNLYVKAFDETGTEIASIPVELTDLSANPKEFFAENKAISLNDVPESKNFLVYVANAEFDDGDVYTASDENVIEYDDSDAPLQDVLALRELASDAICYSKENDDHWRCVCGRPNFSDADRCVRCLRDKETVLKNFSSKSALNDAISAAKEQERQKALEEEMALIEKKKKRNKKIITSLIVGLLLALLSVIGFFIRIGIINLMANNAVKSKDYLKAYELYSEVNSSKISTITDKVIGNTPSNLMFGAGFLAEDEENFYFITRNSTSQPGNLVKENKKTFETTILTDAASRCLNVVGDYIYFINKDSLPCRMTKDGKSIETIFETQLSYICVVGNDMYYTKTDYDNPKGFTEEECEILASQGQIESYTRIHKYNLNKKEDSLVSEEKVHAFSLYGDRIYYLTPSDSEDTWAMSNLKSMNINGKDIVTHYDSPVVNFLVKDDVLYFIPAFDESIKGSQITDVSAFDYSIYALKLDTGETRKISSDSDLIMDMNVSEDSIVMISFDREKFLAAYSGTAEGATFPEAELKIYITQVGMIKTVASYDASAINVIRNEIFFILSDGTMARTFIGDPNVKIIAEDGTSVLQMHEETPIEE